MTDSQRAPDRWETAGISLEMKTKLCTEPLGSMHTAQFSTAEVNAFMSLLKVYFCEISCEMLGPC